MEETFHFTKLGRDLSEVIHGWKILSMKLDKLDEIEKDQRYQHDCMITEMKEVLDNLRQMYEKSQQTDH